MYGSTGKPTGSPLAISDTVNTSSITSSYQLIDFNFSGVNKILLSGATNYCIVFCPNLTSPGTVQLGSDNTAATAQGVLSFSSNSGSSWSVQTGRDLIFYVYGTATLPAFTFGYGNYGLNANDVSFYIARQLFTTFEGTPFYTLTTSEVSFVLFTSGTDYVFGVSTVNYSIGMIDTVIKSNRKMIISPYDLELSFEEFSYLESEIKPTGFFGML